MNLKQTKEAIECCFISNIPIMLWGHPGTAKSSIINQLAVAQQVLMKDIRLTYYDSVDLRGCPSITVDSKTTWNPPDDFPYDPDSVGIIFFDELPQADIATQKAALQLVLDRKLGNYVLPIGWRIVAAGNPGLDRLTEALANRFLHVEVTPSVDEFVSYGLSMGFHSDILSFVRARPQLLSTMPTNEDEYAFPSLRTWEYASKLHTDHGDSYIHKELLEGVIGKGATLELIGHINLIAKLPTIDQLIADPYGYDFNDSPSKIAAICLMVASGIENTNVDQLMLYVNTIQKEFQVLIITLINDTKNSLMGTNSITKWCISNPDIF